MESKHVIWKDNGKETMLIMEQVKNITDKNLLQRLTNFHDYMKTISEALWWTDKFIIRKLIWKEQIYINPPK